MQSFYLIDGSMVWKKLGASFNDPQAAWLRPLSVHPSMGLAAPLLVAPALVQSPEQLRDLARAKRAFPQQLHCSILQSDDNLEALAKHLRQFVSFIDPAGERYGLRFADCRVLAYLPQILTPEQWQALSAPIAEWQIFGRAGQEIFLSVGAAAAAVPLTKPFALSTGQIDQLIQAGEADGLLANLGHHPKNIAVGQIQTYHHSATQCISIWQDHCLQNPGRSDRRVLNLLVKKVLQGNCAWLSDKANVQNELKKITESLAWN